MEITFEKINKQHLAEIINVHQRSFGASFSTLMGKGFLEKMYGYPLKNSKTFGTVAKRNGKVVGVVLGTEDPSAHRKNFFSDNFFTCIKSVSKAFLKDPSLIKVSLKKKNLLNDVNKAVLSKFKKSSKIEGSTLAKKKSTLLSICVLEECRGSNVAADLVDIFIETSKHRGCDQATLSVQAENIRAVKFYEKLDWQPTWEGVNSEGKISRGYKYELKN